MTAQQGVTIKGPRPGCKGGAASIRVSARGVEHVLDGQVCKGWADLYNYIRAVKGSPLAYCLSQVLGQLPRTSCQGCGAAITFVQTHRGRLLPLNLDGDHAGDAHWATCPEAQKFR